MKKLIVVLLICMFTLAGCSSFKRGIKDWKSDFSGGLNRRITVYSLDGDIIAEYYGKIDIDDNDNIVIFELNGETTIIYNAIVIAQEEKDEQRSNF